MPKIRQIKKGYCRNIRTKTIINGRVKQQKLLTLYQRIDAIWQQNTERKQAQNITIPQFYCAIFEFGSCLSLNEDMIRLSQRRTRGKSLFLSYTGEQFTSLEDARVSIEYRISQNKYLSFKAQVKTFLCKRIWVGCFSTF